MSYRSDNVNTGEYAHGSRWGFAGNNITIRGADITEGVPSQKPSKNLAEASLKTLRLYRKACRLIPFILRTHELLWRVNSNQAKLSLAQVFREKAHLRDTAQIDFWVTQGYIKVMEAEQHHTYSPFLYQYLSPQNSTPSDRGYNYLDEKKYQGKTGFLKGFYKGIRPNY